jgi:putative membrane protein insertion efficiency factor
MSGQQVPREAASVAEGIAESGADPSAVESVERKTEHDQSESGQVMVNALPDEQEDALSEDAPSASAEDEAENSTFVVRLALGAIGFYQRFLSPLTPPSCRFYPTCSHYAFGSIRRFGLLHGGWLGLKRLCKCHPFHAGGYDPVPEKETSTRTKHLKSSHLI